MSLYSLGSSCTEEVVRRKWSGEVSINKLYSATIDTEPIRLQKNVNCSMWNVIKSCRFLIFVRRQQSQRARSRARQPRVIRQLGYTATKPEQLQVVATILGRQGVMQHYITVTFLRSNLLMLTSPDHFLRAHGQATRDYCVTWLLSQGRLEVPSLLCIDIYPASVETACYPGT